MLAALSPDDAIALRGRIVLDDEVPVESSLQVVEQPAGTPQLQPETQRRRKPAADQVADVLLGEEVRGVHDGTAQTGYRRRDVERGSSLRRQRKRQNHRQAGQERECATRAHHR